VEKFCGLKIVELIVYFECFCKQVSQVEKEMNAEWKSKCDKLLATAQEKHNRALQDVKEEKEDLEQKITALQTKVLLIEKW